MNPSSDTELVFFTVAVALGATVLMAPFGVALGWVLARWSGVGRQLLETLCLLPLVLPPTAVGLLLLTLLSADSAMGRLLGHFHIELLFTWRAVVLASAVMGSPLLIRAAKDAFGKWTRACLAWRARWGTARGKPFAEWPCRSPFVESSAVRCSRSPGRWVNLAPPSSSPATSPVERRPFPWPSSNGCRPGMHSSAMRLVAVTVVLAFLAVWGTELLQRRKGRAPA